MFFRRTTRAPNGPPVCVRLLPALPEFLRWAGVKGPQSHHMPIAPLVWCFGHSFVAATMPSPAHAHMWGGGRACTLLLACWTLRLAAVAGTHERALLASSGVRQLDVLPQLNGPVLEYARVDYRQRDAVQLLDYCAGDSTCGACAGVQDSGLDACEVRPQDMIPNAANASGIRCNP